MAKIIKLTPDIIESVREQITKSLLQIKLSDGKLTFSQTFDNIDRKATIFFSEVAWAKMISLIYSCDKEIAWHGLARRGEDETKDEYYIYDLIIYPQEVTGCTVTTDQEKYQTWLYDRPDEEFNDIRMQGHSHVNMSTTPSGVDTSFYDRILEQLSGDMFYIFMIWNKRGEKTIKLYDIKKNILFETKDCEVRIADNGLGIKSFLKSAGEMVAERAYNYSSTSSKSTTTTPLKESPKSEPKKEIESSPKQTNTTQPKISDYNGDKEKSKLRKGKRKQSTSISTAIYGAYGAAYNCWDEENNDW